MVLTNAQRQARWRANREALTQGNPDVVERALLQEAERAERGELSAAECFALADKLMDAANAYLGRMRKLAEMARKIRPPGGPPGAPP
jgi:hypothetical protein